MSLEVDDRVMIHRLQTDLERATYDRAVSTFAARPTTPRLGGAVVVAAAVAAVTVMAWPGSSSPALAWNPTPSAATAADEAAASAACSTDLGGDSQRDGEVLPVEFPPLVALDLRGTGGIATFSDDNMTLACLLVRDGDGFERGPIVGQESSTAPNAGTAVVGATSTEWKDGTTIAMLTGVAPAGAATVEISIPGQSTATAVVTNGHFAMWWFGTVENLSGSVSSFDATGVELGRIDLGVPKGDAAQR